MCDSYRIEVAHRSDTGRRAANQDRVAHFETPFGYVVAVADGMGGHRGGELAASLVVERLPRWLHEIPPETAPAEALVLAIRNLSREVNDVAQRSESARGMGSTVAALLLRFEEHGPMAITAHAGDSRVYFRRAGKLFRLTRDHTLIQDLVESGALAEEEAMNHPQSHVLTRSVGQANPLDVETSAWMLLRPDDLFLLCSDGLSGVVREDSIDHTLAGNSNLKCAADSFVELALERGSADNVTVALVRVTQPR